MAAHHKSLVKEVIDRLDERMALNESRGQAKEEARSEGKATWAFTTNKMHSYKTRAVYQEHIFAFANWARDTYTFKQLSDLDERADELATEFLQRKLDEGKSAYTLQVIRSALRLFFANRTLMQEVHIPPRTRATITRSRGPKAHDKHFNPEHWPKLIHFLQATGLRRDELKMLCANQIVEYDLSPESSYCGQTIVHIWNGKGGKARKVPVLAGHEQDVLAAREGLADGDLIFPCIPKHLDVHSYHREYAQSVYLYHAAGRSLPPTDGRLKREDYDRAAAYQVTLALGIIASTSFCVTISGKSYIDML